MSFDHSAPTGPLPPAADEEMAAQPPQRIGRHRVERILGQGGFGIVYLAHDEDLERPVAIKVPHRRLVAQPEDAKLYLAEARIVAGLDHPNIVPVYDVGSTEDCPCFVVSKFIEGNTLSKRIRSDRLSTTAAAELVATVAETLHYAHRKGVVHRDIKPGNILLDTVGKPYVADFGLALREANVGAGPRYIGTLPYMSPEQARGEGHRVDGRSDIFSLGIVFYELLTGRRPFHSDSRAELLEQIATQEARPPRQWEEAIPKELERICLKALTKRASERYTTARDMADDLRYFLTANASSLSFTPSSAPPPAAEPASPRPSSSQAPIVVVPKGLRSFDARDTDFFLQLLPGPRDRDSLPESLRAWKQRLEERDADQTFAVGLLYGPSGCGKSSFVKAGLLPRLASHVMSVYVEATAAETESRLLKALRKHCPALRTDSGLPAALADLRRGLGLPAGEKLLIVLDQFEQWLHARQGQENTELVTALRQCEGARVQCLILVRDDFWMAATHLLRELEVRLVEGENAAAVDLFDLRHAKKVLALFGRAYGALPERTTELSVEQTRFLDQAAQELAQDGKVIPVRLAVFAEMVKGREWTPATLKSLGGMEGVGVTFLEEAFSSAAAPPAHRVHQVAARAVLKALLPEQGTDIRGNLRPYQELLEASGYAGRPRDFEELLRILDRELRLVSPSTPEGTDSESGRRAPSPEGQFYQLTHDYLVPALRAWLTRKQKETRRGRAEIRLAERAALWSHKPENRHLPSWWEWARIRLLTRPRDWTEPQRAMMRRAAGLHAVRGLALAIVVVLAVWGGWHYVSRLKEQALVDGLRSAGPAEMAAILKEIGRHPRRLEGPLRAAYAEAEAKGDTEGKLRLSLALLPSDPSQAEYLYTRLFDVQPQEFITVRDTLAPYKEEYIAQLWAELDNRAADPERPKRRFRAACALARYAPNDQRWAKYGPFVVQWLVAENALVLSYWNEALQPVGPELLDALAGALEDNHWGLDERRTLTELYRGFAAGTEDGFMPLEKRLADGATVGGSGAKHVALARRKANVAAALVALGRGEAAWPLLIHSDDPTVRSCLIERLSSAGVDPRILVERLDKESNLSARRALVLALGGFSQDQVPLVEPVLLKLCENAIDPGLHAAAGWLLRRWGHDEQLQQIDQRLATGKLEGGRRWYVNKQGQTFTIIRSSPSARGGGPAHPQISQMAPVFAIASTEVTVVQFRAFKVDHQPDRDVAPTDVCPVNLVSWYDAAAYCNWLSEQARIPKSQWCYQKNKAGMLESASDYMLRIGYRLPTEAEWEFACRAGARTGWYFGEADAELAGKYAWWYGNSQADGNPRAYPVGSLKPNDWGLFDMHGNLSEWCQDPMTRSGSVGGAKDRPGGFWNDVNCRVRGGSYRAPFVDIGCASWALSGRKMRLPALGFRPVQTRR